MNEQLLKTSGADVLSSRKKKKSEKPYGVSPGLSKILTRFFFLRVTRAYQEPLWFWSVKKSFVPLLGEKEMITQNVTLSNAGIGR